MDDMKCFCEEHPFLTTVASGLVFATAGIVVYRLLRSDDNENYPSDTVILHQIGRGPFAPSMTPFAVKVETYLRMSKIPYENVHDRKKSVKGKFPWISYNGQSVADSAFCIDFINSRRGIDLNNWLTPEQKGIALAFQRLAEDDLYWAMVVQRWVQEVSVEFFRLAFHVPLSWITVKFLVTPAVRRMAMAQGMGRHTKEEVLHIFRRDLSAISDFMGNKPFLMGDSPCEQDCAVFGQLSQLYWQLPGPAGTLFREEFPRLVSYCERMKSLYWPDWVDCTTKGGTTRATR